MRLEFKIIFPPDIKIVSVNSQYEPKRARGGKIMGFYLNPEVAKMMAFIQKSLRSQGFKKSDITNDWGLLKVECVYIFKENFFKRDVDNCTKHAQDAVFRYFNRNDALVIDLHCRKYLNPSADFESIIYSIEGIGTDSSLYNLDVLAQSSKHATEDGKPLSSDKNIKTEEVTNESK